ncbi:zinc finger BED domain-containing protein RICESLEEPER 2-like protein [Tanacetum coccineum]
MVTNSNPSKGRMSPKSTTWGRAKGSLMGDPCLSATSAISTTTARAPECHKVLHDKGLCKRLHKYWTLQERSPNRRIRWRKKYGNAQGWGLCSLGMEKRRRNAPGNPMYECPSSVQKSQDNIGARGCQVFLAQISAKKEEDKSERKQIEDVPIVRDFPEVFPEDLPGTDIKEMDKNKEKADKTEHDIEKSIKNRVQRLDLICYEPFVMLKYDCGLDVVDVSMEGRRFPSRGIHVDPAKIESIKDWASPKTPTEIRQFLGLAGYYRRFIEGFSKIAKSMTRDGNETRMDLEENTIHVTSTQNSPSNLQEDNHVRDNVEEVLEPPAKKNNRLRSLVWNHFEKIIVDGKQKAECHLCKSKLSGESNHGTRHLHDHLKSCKKRKQPDIRERLLAGNSKSNLSTYVYNEKDGRMSLAKMVILHEFLYVPCPHTSEVLTNVLMEALMEWNVDTKLSNITLYKCAPIDKLIDTVKDKLQSSHLIKEGAHIHMRCCAHILNLIVKVGLSVIKVAIDNVRESVSYWTATPKRVEKFEETCRQLKITYSKALDVFTRLKQRDSHYKTLPSPLEWENARVICKKLEVFHNVTAIFSGTRYPTANLYFPKVCDIRLKLNEWLVSPNQLVSNMSSKMIEKFDEYWGAIHELMAVAGVFDPRSKMEMIEFYFPLIYPDDSAIRIQKVRKICEALILEYQEKALNSQDESGNNMGSSSTNSMEVDENMSAWEKHIMCKSSVPQSCIVMEFGRYLEEGLEPRSPDFDILLWWKLRGAKYPVMQAIARDILAYPTPHRIRLRPDTIEALMCAQSWLWEIVNKDDGKPFTSDNNATIFDDYDTDDEGEDEGKGGDQELDSVLVKGFGEWP